MPSRVREGDCPDCDETRTTRWIRGVCHRCYLLRYHAGTLDELRPARGNMVPCSVVLQEKCCTGCNVVKPADAFSLDRRRVNGLAPRCKACMSEYRSSRPEHYRNFELQRNYGITSEEYDQMYYDQNGLCLICSEEEPGGRLMPVDHCHATGKIRGLLCANCNRGLGIFKDDPDRLVAAAMYLLRQTDALVEIGGTSN